MAVITLNEQERGKFIAYLEQEAVTNNGMSKAMAELKGHEVMAQRLKDKALACIMIADGLKRTEDDSIVFGGGS